MNNDNDNDDERIAMMETKINNNNNNNNGNETKQQKQEAVPSSSSSSSFNNNKKEKFIGITILITAQVACASTATCVHALPIETPSVLRGLWRQTLTSIIFAVFSFIVWIFHFQQQQRQSQSSSSSTLTLTSSRNNNNIGSYNNNSYYANNGGGDTNNNSINNSKKNSITNLSSESLLSVGEQEALLQTVERINSTNNSNNNSYKDDNPSLNNDHDHYRQQQQQQQQQEKEGLIATTTTTNKTTTDTSTATATDSTNDNDNNNNNDNQTTTRLFYIILAVIGATLLNDTMVVALKYASSAAVMCLVNTTPIWLILYAIIICRPPSSITIAGATVSLIGAMICAMGGGGGGGSDGGSGSGVERGGQEELGSIIAMTGGVGGAMYMTACRKLSPLGLHPVYLTLMINVGMMLSSLLLCLVTIDDSLEMMSTNTNNGFWGFLNSNSNPAATLQSIFPDCLGCFGIMIALGFFDPLIVSMVMLTEPLNASLIAMAVVHEPPPSNKTVLGVSIVLLGCALVLWETSKAGRKASELEKQIDNVSSSSGEYDVDEVVPPPPSALTREESKQLQKSYEQQRRTSNVLLLSTIKTIAPGITVKAAGWKRQPLIRPARIMSLAPKHYRHFGLSGDARRAATATGEQTSLLRPLGQQQQQQQQDSDISSSSRRSTMPSIAVFQSLRSSLVKYARESSRYIYGSFEEDDDNEDYNVI